MAGEAMCGDWWWWRRQLRKEEEEEEQQQQQQQQQQPSPLHAPVVVDVSHVHASCAKVGLI